MQAKQKALFRLGRLIATPEFLTKVPRAAMVDAIRRYATGDFGETKGLNLDDSRHRVDHGRRIVARYQHAATRFEISTDADGSITRIALAEEPETAGHC